MKTVSLPLLGALSTVLLAANLSLAAPITGSLDFSGGAKLDGTTLGSATKVLSWSSVAVTSVGVTPGSVLDTTINPGDSVAMPNPWPFTSGVAGLWSVGGFTFDLVTSGIVSQTNDFLSVKGYGTVAGNAFDPTPGTWFFTSQGGPIGQGNFSFSATTNTSVPDGGTTSILLGAALVGLAAGAKRRNRHA